MLRPSPWVGLLVRIGLLNNLRAGRNRKRVEHMLADLGGASDVLHFETASAEMLPDAVGELERAQVELLIVNGGDGTIERVLSEVLGRTRWRPVFAPLRGGRTNMTAADLRATRNPRRGLREVVAAARSGRLSERIVERAVLRVDPGRGALARYGMFLGAGFLARAVTLTPHHFPTGRAQEGFGVAMVTSALLTRFLSGLRGELMQSDKMQIALDGEQLPSEEYVIVLMTTCERLIFGMRPYWGTGPGPIRTTVIAGRAERIARAVPPILWGRPPAFATAAAGYISANVHRAALTLDASVTLDGEVFAPEPSRTYQVSAIPGVRFARA